MKICNVNFINYSPNKFENKKEQKNSYVQFDNFSSSYCAAIKSLNLPFKGKIDEEQLKQKLEKELLAEQIDIDVVGDYIKEEYIEKIQKAFEYFSKHPDFPIDFRDSFFIDVVSDCKYCEDENFYSGIKKFNEVYQIIMANPELYINGEAEDALEAQEEIYDYVFTYQDILAEVANTFDKNTMEFIFRKRIDNAAAIFERFIDLEDSSKELLKKMFQCKNVQGKELSSKEKLALLNIIAGYEACNVDLSEIKLTDKIDIETLEKDLLKQVFKFCGMEDEEIDSIPKEIISKWDINYAHLLALQERTLFDDGDNALAYIIRAVNHGKDFKTYIHGDNYFGTINFATKEKFKQFGLNYENWLNPPKDCEVQFKYIDSNQERLTQIAGQIEEDIETLRKTPAKNFIDKHFSDCVINGKFKINEKYYRNKQSLETFAKNMFELLDKNIFTRAQANLENPDKKKNALNTLTIKNHLEQRLKDVSKCETKKKEKPIDLTIKMWDRNPTHDLFQGNYSTCCIGLGESNGTAMPTYLLCTMFNMIELVDNSTGETIGNALCYFAQNEFDEPQFIIDNIEIANKYNLSDVASDKLLDKITGYCINLLKNISNKNIPILMGTNFNDVDDEQISTIELEYLRIIGNMDYEMTYLDVFGGWDEGEFDFNYPDKPDDAQEKPELLYLADSRQDEEIVDDEILDEWY